MVVFNGVTACSILSGIEDFNDSTNKDKEFVSVINFCSFLLTESSLELRADFSFCSLRMRSTLAVLILDSEIADPSRDFILVFKFSTNNASLSSLLFEASSFDLKSFSDLVSSEIIDSF